MPVRIYALAKELNVDSKALVDLCAKAGVSGKGSALASLTDEEVDKVKAYLSNASSRSAPAKEKPASTPAPMEPSSLVDRDRKISTIPTGRTRRDQQPEEPAATPAAETPEVPEAPQEQPPTPAAETGKPSVPTVTPTSAPPPPSIAEPNFDAIAKAGNKVRTLTKRLDRKSDGGERESSRQSGPAIRVAPMPTVQQPPPKPKADEPAPQKPDIRLPADAIRAGSNALKERVRKLEEKRKSGSDKTPAAERRGGTTGTADAATTGAKDRPRRGKGDEDERDPLTRQDRTRKRNKRSTRRRANEDEFVQESSGRRLVRRKGSYVSEPRKTKVVVELPCTVRSFSEAIGVGQAQILRKLVELGHPLGSFNINSQLDDELAEMLAVELGVEVDFRHPVDLEEQLLQEFDTGEEPDENLVPRPPVVTFLGHVDHGKTSLLDRIIGLKVVEGEAGGITQHIRAYQIDKAGRPITFVDTPGHEAFTEMRARGANVTDIAVLVVAADDGVMPQTEEAISHARAAGVPIVVALNKIDLPGVDVNRIMQQLAANELLPTEWGGDTELVRCSAMTGDGIDDLLETLLTIAELHEYKANSERHATGTCIEAERHEGRGVVAKMLVQKGTLKVGDILVCGPAYGRVKAMYDTLNPRQTHEEAGLSMPVNLTGLNDVPGAGDHFYVLEDISQARELAEQRIDASRARNLSGVSSHISLEGLSDALASLGHNEVRTLNLIIRADVRGSIEAIQKELGKLVHPEVQIKILQATVGGISEADVHLADASDAIIIGFNVVPDEGARALADDRGVEVRRYDIIYRLTEDLKLALEGLLKPEEQERELGRALVKQAFSISRVGTVAGCQVLGGTIRREANVRVRVIRNNTIIGDYPLDSLRREKDDVREVAKGYECGIRLAGFNDIKEGDILEAYKIEEVARTL